MDRRPVDPRRGQAMIGRHIAVRLDLQGWQTLVMEPLPHLRLPAPISTLNRRLKPHFPRWGEHRHNLQAQAQADHPPQGIGMLMGALKMGLVIKLRIGRQAPRPPVLQQGFGDHRSGDAGPWPRADQAPMQRDDLEDFNLWATGDDEALDEVDAIDLSPGSGHLWQIPAEPWGPAADPLSGIQGAPSRQNAADRAQRRPTGSPRWSRSRRIAAAPNAPSTLVSLSSRRTVRTRSPTAVSVRRMVQGMGGRSAQSTRSKRC